MSGNSLHVTEVNKRRRAQSVQSGREYKADQLLLGQHAKRTLRGVSAAFNSVKRRSPISKLMPNIGEDLSSQL
jgi:hypothetical protein